MSWLVLIWLCMCLRQAAPPATLADALVHDPGRLSALCAALCQCFAFETSSAALLLFAVPDGSAYVPSARKTLVGDPGTSSQTQEPEARGDLGADEMATPGTAPSPEGQDAESAHEPESASGRPAAQVAPSPAHPAPAQDVACDAPPAVLLPRMPMGLALAADPRTYQALAGVARGVGRMAAAAGAGLSPFVVPVIFDWSCMDMSKMPRAAACCLSRIRILTPAPASAVYVGQSSAPCYASPHVT